MSEEVWGIKPIFNELIRTKSGKAGVLLLLFFLVLSIITVIIYPYSYIVSIWSDPTYWTENPVLAQPAWVNDLLGLNLPKNIVIDSRVKDDLRVSKYLAQASHNYGEAHLDMVIQYAYDDFPSEISLMLYVRFNKSSPYLKIRWVKPNGHKILLWSGTLKNGTNLLSISQNPMVLNNIKKYIRETTGEMTEYPSVDIVLFAKDKAGMHTKKDAELLKTEGKPYKLEIDGIFFEEGFNLDAKLVIYGKVYGLLGTDNLRRDLVISFLWGAPIALSFGVLLSVITSLLHLLLGSISAWYGGKIDSIIQRLTEIYMVVPFLSILVVVSMFFRLTIWNLLLTVIALSVFGPGVKSTRSLVLQIKEEPYIEAAVTYGASNLRIILLYIIPKILPTLITSIVSSVPSFVFLEAALAYLGLGDPILPTWGKTINEAQAGGAIYLGYWWWILPPIIMIMLVSMSFALLGYSLDRIVNPKLREL